MATIKENATCSNTVGLVGTSIGAADLVTFKTNDAMAHKAEGLIFRARVLMNECGIYDVEKLGDLDIQLVKFVFNKMKKDERPSRIEDIIDSFIKGISPGSAAAEQEATNDQHTSVAASHLHNVIEFDESGAEVSSGRTSVLAHGFAVGQIIEVKKKSIVQDEQYAIAYINDDGSVGLHRVGQDGKIDTSDIVIKTYDEMIAGFVECNHKIELMPSTKLVTASDGWKHGWYKAVATIAMHRLSETVPMIVCSIQAKPVQRVRAIEAHRIGSLKLAPLSAKLVPKERRDVDQESSLVMQMHHIDAPAIAIGLPPAGCTIPFFHLRK